MCMPICLSFIWSLLQIAFYEEEKDIMAKAKSEWLTFLHCSFQDQENLYLVR